MSRRPMANFSGPISPKSSTLSCLLAAKPSSFPHQRCWSCPLHTHQLRCDGMQHLPVWVHMYQVSVQVRPLRHVDSRQLKLYHHTLQDLPVHLSQKEQGKECHHECLRWLMKKDSIEGFREIRVSDVESCVLGVMLDWNQLKELSKLLARQSIHLTTKITHSFFPSFFGIKF